MGRIIIFTGKGGVGKTCMSAAHALSSAKEGRDTLLVSTDMAHSIGRVLDRPIGESIVKVGEHFDALEINADKVMRTEFADLTSAIGDLFAPSGMHTEYPEDIEDVLGLQDLFSLLKIEELYNEGKYERIIVDCAPTGETLTLLKLPELLSWYIDRLLPVGKAALRLLAPVSERVFDVKLPDENAVESFEELIDRLKSLEELIRDSQTTTLRLVCTPEKMVVEETKRNYMYLNLYGFQVDGLYINRVLPHNTGSSFMEGWARLQHGYLWELEQTFTDIPITLVPWYPEEVCGIDALERVCVENLKDEDLFEVRSHQQGESYNVTDEGYLLSIPVMAAALDHPNICLNGSDLYITVNGFVRCIPLPDTLRHCEVDSVRTDESGIQILFRKEEGLT